MNSFDDDDDDHNNNNDHSSSGRFAQADTGNHFSGFYQPSAEVHHQSAGSSTRSSDLFQQDDSAELHPQTPSPPRYSPSVVSSIGHSGSPSPRSAHHRNVTAHNDAASGPADREMLADRLNQLATRLSQDDNHVDEQLLSDQIAFLENAVSQSHGRPDVLNKPASSAAASSAQAPYRLSELSLTERTTRSFDQHADSRRGAKGTSTRQVRAIVVEATKLNDELTTVVENLRARQEEAEHIQGLLIERAERAAQRIIFLQNRISYLEEELQDNDDELQHLRISLKALEVQLPPHPDEELTRCIKVFKDDYKALKGKRDSVRGSFGHDEQSQSFMNSSPTR